MGILRRDRKTHGNDLRKRPQIVRRQHCMRCHTVLARELTDKLGFASHSTYEWLDRGIWVQGRWFGNKVKCPKCGLEGTLPQDKPLSYEAIEKRKEEKLATEEKAAITENAIETD